MREYRFSRTELLFGKEGMYKLQKAFVTVVGLGAVGSYVVEALVRSGVGHLRLIDFDVINISNFNRQLYALENTIGQAKTKVAKERVLSINPECNVEIQECFFDGSQSANVFNPIPDVLIDAIDSLSPKIELLTSAYQFGVPVIISSMGAATRTDPFCIRIGDISETKECPLAKFVRKRLKKRGIHNGIKCIFSLERKKKTDVINGQENKFKVLQEGCEYFNRGRKRKPLGSFACITGIFGLLAAREAIMSIINKQ